MLDGVILQRRLNPPRHLAAGAFIASLLAGLLVVVLILLAAGAPPDTMIDDLIVQVFIAPAGLAQTITIATPLILVGLSSALAMRVKFWNIGLEGQLWLGAIGASGIAIHDAGPEPIRLAAMLAAASICGAAWIAVPLFLKIKLGVSEIVLTLLLSNTAYLLLQHLLFGAWRDPANSFPVSVQFDDAERLSLLGFGNVHSGLFIALAAALLIALLVDRTRAGFYAAAIGHNPLTARSAGLPVTATIIGVVLLSGALSGLAGGLIVAGTEYRLTQFIGANATFSGIVIAFLARLKPLGIVVAAIAVAGIYNAGTTLKVFYGLSDAIVVLIQGVVLLSLLIGYFFSAYRIDRRRESVPA
jgi:general nucleoside transport system permease protein